jgi:hypothetical protein
MEQPEILDTKVICEHGPYVRIRRWLKGAYPKRGLLTQGITGLETVEEIDIFRPLHCFTVLEE